MNNDRNLEGTIVIASFAILIISIFLSSQRFKERAIYFKNCHIQLDELYLKILNAEENHSLTEEKSEKFISMYEKILENVENHSSFDYLCLRYSLRKNTKNTLKPFGGFSDYLSLILFQAKRYFLILILFILPPFLFILIMFN